MRSGERGGGHRIREQGMSTRQVEETLEHFNLTGRGEGPFNPGERFTDVDRQRQKMQELARDPIPQSVLDSAHPLLIKYARDNVSLYESEAVFLEHGEIEDALVVNQQLFFSKIDAMHAELDAHVQAVREVNDTGNDALLNTVLTMQAAFLREAENDARRSLQLAREISPAKYAEVRAEIAVKLNAAFIKGIVNSDQYRDAGENRLMHLAKPAETQLETQNTTDTTYEQGEQVEQEKRPWLNRAKRVVGALIDPISPAGKSKVGYGLGVATGLWLNTTQLSTAGMPVRLAYSGGLYGFNFGYARYAKIRQGLAKRFGSPEKVAKLEKKYERGRHGMMSYSAGLAATSLLSVVGPELASRYGNTALWKAGEIFADQGRDFALQSADLVREKIIEGVTKAGISQNSTFVQLLADRRSPGEFMKSMYGVYDYTKDVPNPQFEKLEGHIKNVGDEIREAVNSVKEMFGFDVPESPGSKGLRSTLESGYAQVRSGDTFSALVEAQGWSWKKLLENKDSMIEVFMRNERLLAKGNAHAVEAMNRLLLSEPNASVDVVAKHFTAAVRTIYSGQEFVLPKSIT